MKYFSKLFQHLTHLETETVHVRVAHPVDVVYLGLRLYSVHAGHGCQGESCLVRWTSLER